MRVHYGMERRQDIEAWQARAGAWSNDQPMPGPHAVAEVKAELKRPTAARSEGTLQKCGLSRRETAFFSLMCASISTISLESVIVMRERTVPAWHRAQGSVAGISQPHTETFGIP